MGLCTARTSARALPFALGAPPAIGGGSPSRPSPERALERAGLGVAEEKRGLVDRDAFAQVALGELEAERVQQPAQRRSFLTQPAVQRPRAHAELLSHGGRGGVTSLELLTEVEPGTPDD